MDILEKIVAHKQKEVAERKSLYPVKLLEKSLFFQGKTVSLSEYLKREDKSGIIAEIKRKSPSKGDINPFVSVERTSIAYMQAGASALSVLTDENFFGGKSEDLTEARKFNFCPILRKDFTIDEYQIIEAKSIGADAILLIAAILDKKQIDQFSRVAHLMGMETILEVHGEEELDKVSHNVNIIGVNNRNLKTFETSVETSEKLIDKIPKDFTAISESGISDPETLQHLKSIGYDGFLIGEYFMKNSQPGKACRNFIRQLKSLEQA